MLIKRPKCVIFFEKFETIPWTMPHYETYTLKLKVDKHQSETSKMASVPISRLKKSSD